MLLNCCPHQANDDADEEDEGAQTGQHLHRTPRRSRQVKESQGENAEEGTHPSDVRDQRQSARSLLHQSRTVVTVAIDWGCQRLLLRVTSSPSELARWDFMDGAKRWLVF